MSTWLPPIFSLGDCGGDWPSYLSKLYDIFRQDFIQSKPSLDGRYCKVRRVLAEDGKEKLFWHLISEGADEAERIPSMRRCERLCWIRPMIEGVPLGRTVMWSSNRPSANRRRLVSLADYGHVVVLEEMAPQGSLPYLLLITAYEVEEEHRREKLLKEWQADPNHWP